MIWVFLQIQRRNEKKIIISCIGLIYKLTNTNSTYKSNFIFSIQSMILKTTCWVSIPG